MSSQLIVWLILALVFMRPSEYPVDANARHAILRQEDYPNKCVIKLPKGEPMIINRYQFARHPAECAQIYCGRRSWALIYSCDNKYPPKGCKFGEYVDFDAPFPDCCPRKIKCSPI